MLLPPPAASTLDPRPPSAGPGVVHLFYIHSHITFAVALGVMQHLKLPPADCVVVYDRKYQRALPAGVRVHSLPPRAFVMKTAPWNLWRQIGEQDAEIAALTDHRPYHLYCPHLCIDQVRLLLTNGQCRGYSYLEEGSMSYIDPAHYPYRRYEPKLFVVKYLLSRGRIPNYAPYGERSYERAYVVSPYTFPGMPRLVVLPYPFTKGALPVTAITTGGSDLTGAHLLVMDPVVESHLATRASYELGIALLAEHLTAQRVQRVYYKFHPMQIAVPAGQPYYEELLRRSASGVEWVRLADDVVLEDVAATFADLTFYTIISSMTLYAGFAGHRIYLFARPLLEREPALRVLAAELPPIYWELTTAL